MAYTTTTQAALQSWVDNDYPEIKAKIQQNNFNTILQDIENIKLLIDEVLYIKPTYHHDQGGGG